MDALLAAFSPDISGHDGLQTSFADTGVPTFAEHPHDAASEFLMLPGQKIHHTALATSLLGSPHGFARRLATKAVNKAAWFHDAVVDFQETEFFWQAQKFARRHVVAEAFGLGVVTGGVLLLTAPPSAAPKTMRSVAPAPLSQATLTAGRHKAQLRSCRTGVLPTLPVVREEVEETTEAEQSLGHSSGEELDEAVDDEL